jgi:hypothetical protein
MACSQYEQAISLSICCFIPAQFFEQLVGNCVGGNLDPIIQV